MVPVRRVVPVPVCWTAPLPEIVPAKVVASERLKTSVPALATSPTREPVVPPLPSWRVPPLMVVPPV